MNKIRLLIGLIMVWLSACTTISGTGEQPSPNPRPARFTATANAPETVTPVETAPLPAESGVQSGLTGQIISASDVSGQPDEPLADQMVLALPVDRAGQMLGVSGNQLTPETLRFLKASLPAADPAISVTMSDTAGKYTLLLDPGEVVLCVADSEKTPPDFPASTRGCGLAIVRAGELHRVDISSGFGEILLVER